MSKRIRHRRRSKLPDGQQPRPRVKAEPTLSRFEFRGQLKTLQDAIEKHGIALLKDKTSDTAVAIATTALIDDLLRYGIILKFRRHDLSKSEVNLLFKPAGILGTFASKISLGAVLGLVSTHQMRHDLDLLRDIRNDFCHALYERHFSDQDIAEKCKRLKYTGESEEARLAIKAYKIAPASGPRMQFILSSITILAMLGLTLLYAFQELRLIFDHQDELQKQTKAIYDQRVAELFEIAKAKTEQDAPHRPEAPNDPAKN